MSKQEVYGISLSTILSNSKPSLAKFEAFLANRGEYRVGQGFYKMCADEYDCFFDHITEVFQWEDEAMELYEENLALLKSEGRFSPFLDDLLQDGCKVEEYVDGQTPVIYYYEATALFKDALGWEECDGYAEVEQAYKEMMELGGAIDLQNMAQLISYHLLQSACQLIVEFLEESLPLACCETLSRYIENPSVLDLDEEEEALLTAITQNDINWPSVASRYEGREVYIPENVKKFELYNTIEDPLMLPYSNKVEEGLYTLEPLCEGWLKLVGPNIPPHKNIALFYLQEL